MTPIGDQTAVYHVELVTKNTALTAYMSDGSHKPVDAKGFKATDVFVVGGKAQRIELKPEADNRLSGTSAVVLHATIKGALTIRLPDGKTIQAKFE